MANESVKAGARVVALCAMAVALWFLAKYDYAQPKVLPATAPAGDFSAGRAEQVLARILGPEKPHPVSSDENAAVRARIISEFERMGVKAQTYRAFACNAWRGFRVVPCASVTDIVAEVLPGDGPAVALLAHYDSVPAGPGASDDGSGVSAVIEASRALRARRAPRLHPVLAVITDGEEAGLLGAQAFLENKALAARVGAVVNVEARGTKGRSLLFQTSAGDSKLIDLYANSVPFYATSSLYAEIYRLLPNDTDLTLFIKQGIPSFNFAFSENVADYHTPLDRRGNLSALSLQEQGDNLLGVAASLAQTDFRSLEGGDAVYLDLFGFVLPRMPEMWALPLALIAFALMIVAAWRARIPGLRRRELAPALLLPPALVLASAGLGFALNWFAQFISGQPNPSYAYPIALREGLAFGVLAAALFVGRMARRRLCLLSVWVWIAYLAVITAAFIPGFSPYFLFPALLAAPAALFMAAAPGASKGEFAEIALAPATLLALAIWIGLVVSGETIMGLKLHPLFTVPAAIVAMPLLPYLDSKAMPLTAWRDWTGAALAGAFIAAFIAGLQPAYSDTKAQRLSIRYVQDAAARRAIWAVDADAPLPPSLRAAADFSKTPESYLPGPFPAVFTAPAGPAKFPSPTAEILADTPAPGGRTVTIALHGSEQASAMFVMVPKSAGLKGVDIRGQRLATPAEFDSDALLVCASSDCANEQLSLDLATRSPVALRFGEQRYGLPAFAGKLVAARPANATPSQSGDIVILANMVRVPAMKAP